MTALSDFSFPYQQDGIFILNRDYGCNVMERGSSI